MIASKHKDQPCFGDYDNEVSPKYKWLTYGEVLKKVDEIAGFIERENFMTEEDRFVGIFAANRSEWMITDLAINKTGGTCVPFYTF